MTKLIPKFVFEGINSEPKKETKVFTVTEQANIKRRVKSIFEKKGKTAAFEAADDQDVPRVHCDDCDEMTPTINGECLACGHKAKPANESIGEIWQSVVQLWNDTSHFVDGDNGGIDMSKGEMFRLAVYWALGMTGATVAWFKGGKLADLLKKIPGKMKKLGAVAKAFLSSKTIDDLKDKVTAAGVDFSKIEKSATNETLKAEALTKTGRTVNEADDDDDEDDDDAGENDNGENDEAIENLFEFVSNMYCVWDAGASEKSAEEANKILEKEMGVKSYFKDDANLKAKWKKYIGMAKSLDTNEGFFGGGGGKIKPGTVVHFKGESETRKVIQYNSSSKEYNLTDKEVDGKYSNSGGVLAKESDMKTA